MGGIQRLVILVAEDDENDVFLLERAFRKAGVELPAYICPNGAEAMEYLKGQGKSSDRSAYPFPRCLITDLKMPQCSGFDLLRWLHEHPECNFVPKIVLSASAEPNDVKLAYQLGANCYFRKPAESQALIDLVKMAHMFWSTAELPELPDNC